MKAGAKSENEDSRDRPRACRARCPAWKRALDVILVVLTAPVSLLLGAAIGLVIKLGSRGPVFFRQERVGHQGRSFYMVKFRTMKAGADTSTHRQHLQELIGSEAPMTKLDAKGDKRVVPFGAILRATGLDELPQLLNVLRGEMSLVGPRPDLPEYLDALPAARRQLLHLKPGITSIATLRFRNEEELLSTVPAESLIDYYIANVLPQKANMEIDYASQASLVSDLAVLLRTVGAIFQ